MYEEALGIRPGPRVMTRALARKDLRRSLVYAEVHQYQALAPVGCGDDNDYDKRCKAPPQQRTACRSGQTCSSC